MSNNGAQVVVQTQPTTIEEAVQQGEVSVSQTLTPTNLQRASFAKGVQTVRSPSAPNAFSIQLNNVVLYDEDESVAELGVRGVERHGGRTWSLDLGERTGFQQSHAPINTQVRSSRSLPLLKCICLAHCCGQVTQVLHSYLVYRTHTQVTDSHLGRSVSRVRASASTFSDCRRRHSSSLGSRT